MFFPPGEMTKAIVRIKMARGLKRLEVRGTGLVLTVEGVLNS